MAHNPFEVIPLLVAGAIGMGVLILLISLFDNTNSKITTYAMLGFLTGLGVQVGVRLAKVS
jgi:hypothetical protein